MLENQRIEFVNITAENLYDFCRLSNTLSENQKNCVATNAYSIAEAHYNLDKIWFRGINLIDGDVSIGFIMVDHKAENLPAEDKPGIFMWRLMMSGDYQKKGYASEALDLVSSIFRNEGKQTFYTSCALKEDEEASPYDFYIKYGFVDTGIKDDDEEVLKLEL